MYTDSAHCLRSFDGENMNTVDDLPQETCLRVYKPNEAVRGNTVDNLKWGHDPKVHPELLCVKGEEEEKEVNLWMVPEAEDDYINSLQFIVTTVKSEDEDEGRTGSNKDAYLSRYRKPEGRSEDVLKMCVKEEEEQDDLWMREDKDINRLQLTVTTVKSEDEEKPPLKRQDEESKETKEEVGADSSNPEVSVNEWQEPMRGFDPQPKGGYNEKGVSSKTHQKSFNCSNCGQQFNHKQSLQRHIRRNSDSGSSKGFIMLRCVRLKPDTDSNSGEKLFSCGVCGKRMNYRHNLKTHMRVHTREKSYSCDVCGQRFAYQQNLKSHKRTHTGEKPFVCQVCGKNVCNLKTHLQVHTGDKPFNCSDCGKSFKRKAHLMTHMTVHKGERPFGCELCTKRFNRKTHLRTHMIVHSGEKPFSCELCGKKFSRKTHLDTHFATHTGERPYGCAICGQEFTQPGSLNRHMRFHLG